METIWSHRSDCAVNRPSIQGKACATTSWTQKWPEETRHTIQGEFQNKQPCNPCGWHHSSSKAAIFSVGVNSCSQEASFLYRRRWQPGTAVTDTMIWLLQAPTPPSLPLLISDEKYCREREGTKHGIESGHGKGKCGRFLIHYVSESPPTWWFCGFFYCWLEQNEGSVVRIQHLGKNPNTLGINGNGVPQFALNVSASFLNKATSLSLLEYFVVKMLLSCSKQQNLWNSSFFFQKGILMNLEHVYIL